MPWATALIQAETKSEHSYSGVYKAANAATKRILTLPNCGCKECQTCSYIKELNDNQLVTAVMRCECDENPWRIDKPLGDQWLVPLARGAGLRGGRRLVRRVVVRARQRALAARQRWVRTRGQQPRHGG